MKTGLGCGFAYPHQACVALGKGVVQSAVGLLAERKSRKAERVSKLAFQEKVGSAAAVLEARRYKTETIDAYIRCTNEFAKWRAETPGVGTRMDVGRYLELMQSAEVNNSTVRLHTAALRTVLDRVFELNATGGIVYPPPSAERPPLSDKKMLQLYAAAQGREEYLLLFLLNVLDLRPGLINSLMFDDFLLKARILVVCDRRGRVKKIKLSKEQVDRLKPLLKKGRQSPYLFPSRKKPGQPVSVRCLQQRLKRIADRAGLSTTCTAVRRAKDLLSYGNKPVYSGAQWSSGPALSPRAHLPGGSGESSVAFEEYPYVNFYPRC